MKTKIILEFETKNVEKDLHDAIKKYFKDLENDFGDEVKIKVTTEEIKDEDSK